MMGLEVMGDCESLASRAFTSDSKGFGGAELEEATKGAGSGAATRGAGRRGVGVPGGATLSQRAAWAPTSPIIKASATTRGLLYAFVKFGAIVAVNSLLL